MIPNEKELKPVKIYICISDLYDRELKYCCKRYGNNSKPVFTDREIPTIYLFAGHCRQYFQIRDIHTFSKEYLREWHPRLPSCQTFNCRLNRLSEALRSLDRHLIGSYLPVDCDKGISIVDSMPVTTCASTRNSKVARDIATKGYCSTKRCTVTA